MLDDGTGSLDVKQWVDTEDASATSGLGQQLNGHYVRVLGVLKTFGSKKHVGSHKITPITDYNEVQFHLLEATATHLCLVRGPPEQFASAGDGARVGGDTAMGGMGGGGGAGGGVGGGGGGGGGYAGTRATLGLPENLSHNARIVYDILRGASGCNEGMHINALKANNQLSPDAVGKAIEELLFAGAAYTTVDDSHIAPMDF